MKKLFALLVIFLLAGTMGQAVAASESIPEGFVKLAVTGSNVNLRPIPQSGGSAMAQANTGDVFIAEQWPVVNVADKSLWYRVAFVQNANGNIAPLSSVDTRIKPGHIPFISAAFVTLSPVTAEEDARIRAIPYRKGYTEDLGNSLPEIVSNFGPGNVKREFDMEAIEHFGVGNLVLTTLELPGFEGLLFEDLDTEYTIHGKHFTLTKPGFVYEGIAIATPGFGKEEVRKLMEKKWSGTDLRPEISTEGEEERWNYGGEMWNCTFVFDAQGLVKSYDFYFTTG